MKPSHKFATAILAAALFAGCGPDSSYFARDIDVDATDEVLVRLADIDYPDIESADGFDEEMIAHLSRDATIIGGADGIAGRTGDRVDTVRIMNALVADLDIGSGDAQMLSALIDSLDKWVGDSQELDGDYPELQNRDYRNSNHFMLGVFLTMSHSTWYTEQIIDRVQAELLEDPEVDYSVELLYEVADWDEDDEDDDWRRLALAIDHFVIDDMNDQYSFERFTEMRP